MILKSYQSRRTYKPDTTGFHCSLRAKFKYRLWPWSLTCNIVLVHYTLFCHGTNLCQIIFKSHHAWQNYGLGINRFHWSLNKNLSADFELDLWPTNLVFIYNTSSYHDDHLCQIMLNLTMHDKVVGQSKTGFNEEYAHMWTVTLTFDLATWFLFATHRLDMIIIWAKFIFKSHYAWQSNGPDRNRYYWSKRKV